MPGHLLSYDYRFCPYCSARTYRQRVIPATRSLVRDHVMCAKCDRCLTCEELGSHGFRKNHNPTTTHNPAPTS